MKIRIRIDHPVIARLDLKPNDEIVIDEHAQGVSTLLSSVRVDGVHFAHPVNADGQELAIPSTPSETATTSKGRDRGPRAAAVS